MVTFLKKQHDSNKTIKLNTNYAVHAEEPTERPAGTIAAEELTSRRLEQIHHWKE